MARKKIVKFNFLVIGFISGLIAPLLTSYFYYLTKNVPGITYKGYIDNVFSYGIMTQILSLCLLGNLAVFFLFIWTERDKSARGVIFASFVYGAIIFIFKFFV